MKDILYLDVTPLSLGIRTNGGLCKTLIERNTTIPCQTSLIFSTASDFQTKMTIQLLQGESHLADRNRILGRFTLTELTPAPRGSVQVKVDLKIDANGILTVSACDLGTGLKNQVRIEPGQGTTAEEVNRLRTVEELARNEGAKHEINILESSHRLAYVSRHLEMDLFGRTNPEHSKRLHANLELLNQALQGPLAKMGFASCEVGRTLSEIFLELESSLTSPQQSKVRDTSVSTVHPLANFNILETRAGGMGIVLIVLKEGRIFAVKTPRDELLADPPAVRRFVAEARTWIGLDRHSNIVFASLVREAAGQPYLFLEYADGGNLERWIGKLPVPQALDYAIQICAGMSYAYHKAAIVHRDIKPANILLSNDDCFRFGYAVKVTDFGLAGVWKPAIDSGLDMVETQMSRGMGTWPYMPPEQFPENIQFQYGFCSQPVTVRSDIYSFGVLLLELITGRRPFQSIQEIFTIPRRYLTK
jgi:tRNA A-37 threonylcarbamoyl transferase component Bud32